MRYFTFCFSHCLQYPVCILHFNLISTRTSHLLSDQLSHLPRAYDIGQHRFRLPVGMGMESKSNSWFVIYYLKFSEELEAK